MPQSQNKDTHELNLKVSDLGTKMDAMNTSLIEIKLYLSKMDGIDLPQRVKTMDEQVKNLKAYQDVNSYMPEQLEENTRDIKAIYRSIYMVTGALILLQILMVVFSKFVLDKIFP